MRSFQYDGGFIFLSQFQLPLTHHFQAALFFRYIPLDFPPLTQRDIISYFQCRKRGRFCFPLSSFTSVLCLYVILSKKKCLCVTTISFPLFCLSVQLNVFHVFDFIVGLLCFFLLSGNLFFFLLYFSAKVCTQMFHLLSLSFLFSFVFILFTVLAF